MYTLQFFMVKFITVLALDVVIAFTTDEELLLVPKDVGLVDDKTWHTSTSCSVVVLSYALRPVKERCPVQD